jgi:hypothetical protein
MLPQAPAHVDAATLIADPLWFPQDFNVTTRKLRFVHADRRTLAATPFLAEGMWERSSLPEAEIAESELLRFLPGNAPPPSINFIWHTAFCCSTLIASLLDRESLSLPLKEPGLMLILADAKRQGAIGPGQPFSNRFAELLFRLLGRRFARDEQLVIKPTNLSNYVLRDALALTQGKHLFLFSDCRSFLISILKKREYGRHIARQTYARIVQDGNEQSAWPFADVFAMTDLTIAAVAWHMQIAEFRRNAPRLSPDRAASLDCDAFLATPMEALIAIDRFFGLRLGQEHFEAMLNGPAAKRHSKSPASEYNIANRLEDHATIAARYAEEIEYAVKTSYAICKKTPRSGPPLHDPLIPLDKVYVP